MEEKVLDIFEIGSKSYVLPTEIIYRQYHSVTALFQQAGIDGEAIKGSQSSLALSKEGKLEADFRVGSILTKLMEKELLPKFFASILIPVGATKWKKEFLTENEDDMQDIGDATALKVLQSFLSGRVDLIGGMIQFFAIFMEKNAKLMTSIENSMPKENTQ